MQDVGPQALPASALDAKAKHLIGAAVAYVQQCPDCVRAHTRRARREGATEGEILEAIQFGSEVGGMDPLGHSSVGRRAPWPLDPTDDPWVELDHYE